MKLGWFALMAGSCAWAQHPGNVLYPGTGTPPPPGFGSVLHPGTGGPPRSGVGRGPRQGFLPPAVNHPVHGRGEIVAYPVFYGGYYSYDPSTGYQGPAPAANDNYVDDSGGAPAQSPVVIMNQSFRPDQVNPVLRDYVPPDAAVNPDQRPDDQPTIYLIAMTDHTILAAVGYWVEGDTLSYITQDGDQNKISLALVDRDFSRKLNTDRGVEFRLPAAK